MAKAIRNFLIDERAPNMLIGASVAIMMLGLAVAVGAILLMK